MFLSSFFPNYIMFHARIGWLNHQVILTSVTFEFSFHLLFLLYVAGGAIWSFCTAANAREDERVGAMSPLHLNRHIHCTSILIRIVGNAFSLYCRMDVADCYLRQGAGGMKIARDGSRTWFLRWFYRRSQAYFGQKPEEHCFSIKNRCLEVKTTVSSEKYIT